MNLDNRQRILAVVAGLALAVLAGDRLLVSPLIKSWSERSKRLADLRQRVTQGAVLIDRESTIRRRWADMRTNALSAQVSIAESQLLEAFDRWSRESGVSITSIQPQRNVHTGQSRTLEYRANAFGNLSSLTRFLYLIERDGLGVKIDSLELSTRDKQANQLNLILQVSGLTLAPSGS